MAASLQAYPISSSSLIYIL